MSRKKSNSMGLLLAALLLLLGVVAFQWYQNSQLKSEINIQNKNILDIEKVNIELEQDYETALSNLEELRGDNQELNNLIDKQKSDLAQQKVKISNLLYAKNQLGEAKLELESLRTQGAIYVNEIKKLRDENNQLVIENSGLITQNKSLNVEKVEANQQIEKLDSEKSELLTIKESITQKNEQLSGKVDIAKAIKINFIDVQGYKIKNNGELSKKSRAKNIEVLRTCFKTETNVISDSGDQTFQIRLITASGETVYLEDAGSGEIINKMDGTSVRYTTEGMIDYQNADTEGCIDFKPNYELSKGKYIVQVYNQGYMVGQGDFQLK